MKVCPNKKCRATDIAPDARYCPHCGIRFPFAKDVKLVELGQWNSLKKKAQPSSGKTRIERTEYNRIVNSYNSMVNNGYVSPISDKELITDTELEQLRRNSAELDRWKHECDKRRNTPIYEYEDEYTNNFYWGNALLGIAILGVVVFWLFFGIPTIWGWLFGSDESKEQIEIVLDEKNKKYGIYDNKSNSLVAPYEYDSINHYKGYNNRKQYSKYTNIFYLYKDGKIGVADSMGRKTIDCEMESIEDVSNGLFVFKKDGKQGLFDSYGRIVIPCDYQYVLWEHIPYFSLESPGYYIGNIIPVKKDENNGWELYNRSGKRVGYRKYYSVTQTGDPNYVKVYEKTYEKTGKRNSYAYKYGILDDRGQQIIPFKYNSISTFGNDRAWAKEKNSDSWSLISTNGEHIVTLSKNQTPCAFSEGLAAIKENNKIGYCDISGKIVIPFIYEARKSNNGGYYDASFNYSRAYVSLDGKPGVLDKNGKFFPDDNNP